MIAEFVKGGRIVHVWQSVKHWQGVAGSLGGAVTRVCLGKLGLLRVVRHGYCAAVKECADLGFVVN